jgi:hypothetical protein
MTAAMAESPFSPEAVAAVTRHMNDDHAADNVVICRVLGRRPDVTGATMTGMDERGIEFRVDVGDGEAVVRIPWITVPTTRADVRTEVVNLYQAATDGPGPG